MSDLRGLFVGNWLNESPSGPSPQKVQGVLSRLKKSTHKKSVFPIINVDGRDESALVLLDNPTWSDVTKALESLENVTPDTILVFYYVGHSVPHGASDLAFHFRKNEGSARPVAVSKLLGEIRDQGVERVILIADTCHAGRINMDAITGDYYLMSASGDNYTFDAQFSEALIRQIERPLRKGDPRIDVKNGGVTLQKIFGTTRSGLSESYMDRNGSPTGAGPLADLVIKPVSNEPPIGYNPFAKDRSIYHRLYIAICKICAEQELREEQFFAWCAAQDAFALERDRTGGIIRSVSQTRLADYLNFMDVAGWIDNVNGRLRSAERGRIASRKSTFNQCVLEDVEKHFFPPSVNFQELDRIIVALLENMQPTSPSNIILEGRARGHRWFLTDSQRFALSLMPATGRFQGATTGNLFPSAL